MGFSRQEYYGGLPFSSPGDLPNPGMEPRSPTLQADTDLTPPVGREFPRSTDHVWGVLRSLWSSAGVPGYSVYLINSVPGEQNEKGADRED